MIKYLLNLIEREENNKLLIDFIVKYDYPESINLISASFVYKSMPLYVCLKCNQYYYSMYIHKQKGLYWLTCSRQNFRKHFCQDHATKLNFELILAWIIVSCSDNLPPINRQDYT